MRFSKTTVGIAGGVVVALVILGLLVALTGKKEAPPTTANNPAAQVTDTGSVTYTSADTNQTLTDLPGKALEVTAQPPRVQLGGLDGLYQSGLLDDQIRVVLDTLTSYLLARSGDRIVQASVKDDAVQNMGSNTYSFTVISYAPLVNCTVTVNADPAKGAVAPEVSIKPVREQ